MSLMRSATSEVKSCSEFPIYHASAMALLRWRLESATNSCAASSGARDFRHSKRGSVNLERCREPWKLTINVLDALGTYSAVISRGPPELARTTNSYASDAA